MLRRLALTTAVALVVGAGWASNAVADISIEATVFGSGGSQTIDTTSLEDLGGCPNYTGPSYIPLYNDDGSLAPEQQITAASWTIGAVLGCLSTQINPATVGGVTIVGPKGLQDGPNSELTSSDLQSGTTDGIIYSEGEGLVYVRPQRNSGDANADDNFTTEDGGTFSFDVYEGPLLNVKINGPTTAAVGTPVQFTPTVSQPAAAGLTYSWEFGSGAPASSTSEDPPPVTFSGTGYWKVTLQVTDTAGGGGAATITVDVGNPTPQTSTTPHQTGPAKSQGKTVGGHAGRHDHAGSTTSHRAKAKAKSKQPAAATTPSPSASADRTSTANPLAGRHTTKPTSKHGGRARAHRSTPSPAGPTGPFVTGRLISDVVPVPASHSPLVHAVPEAAATAPPLSDAVGSSALPALGAALGVVLLLGLGAGRELLGRRHPWA